MDLLNVLLNLHCLGNWMGTDTCAECYVKFVRPAVILVHLLDFTAICLGTGVIWRVE